MGTSARPNIHFFTPEIVKKAPKKRKKATFTTENKSKARYQLTNWPAYNQALIQRGRLQLWLDEQTLQNWYYSGERRRGAAYRYSDACIECALQLKYVLGLAFRQTQGLLSSLIELMDMNLHIPSYSQLCRRQARLNHQLSTKPSPIINSQGGYIVVDSTGLKLYGEGEWKVRQHGLSKRRSWRKVHLAYDESTHQILAISLTNNDIDDAYMLEPLLEQISLPIAKVAADGAYDRQKVYDYLQKRQIQALIPPRVNAIVWKDKKGQILAHQRNQAVIACKDFGLAEWKKQTGYHRRSMAETAMYRLKTTFGERLKSRLTSNQKVEVRIKATCLNQFSKLTRPQAIKITTN
jgi:hypothetical protein